MSVSRCVASSAQVSTQSVTWSYTRSTVKLCYGYNITNSVVWFAILPEYFLIFDLCESVLCTWLDKHFPHAFFRTHNFFFFQRENWKPPCLLTLSSFYLLQCHTVGSPYWSVTCLTRRGWAVWCREVGTERSQVKEEEVKVSKASARGWSRKGSRKRWCRRSWSWDRIEKTESRLRLRQLSSLKCATS